MQKTNKILIWDFDGTLAWRSGGWSGALLSVMQNTAPEYNATRETIGPYLQSGFPWHAPENIHPGLSDDEWWDDLIPLFARAFRGAGVISGQTLELAREVRSAYLDLSCWHPFEDALPALKTLSEKNWTHVLLTNHVPELPKLINRLGFSDIFPVIFNSAQTGYEKPNPKAFRAVLEWAGPVSDVWVIGDSYNADYVGAREIGLPAILVRKPFDGAYPFCQSLQEIAAVLPD